jgi:putative addiction module component (TIGR02574 family)
MSKAEILCEISKLTPEERGEIRQKLDELDDLHWIDGDDPLTEEDKARLEARLADMKEHPEKSIPWEEAEARLEARFGE